jgi:hypothetical protein
MLPSLAVVAVSFVGGRTRRHNFTPLSLSLDPPADVTITGGLPAPAAAQTQRQQAADSR